MPTVERTFTVAPSPADVIAYLQDFSHSEEWDPGTKTCTQSSPGQVQVGTRWRNVSTFAGRETELEYELTELTHDRLVFVGRNDSATTTDTITVRPAGNGSELTYHADLQLHGAAALAAPAVKLLFEKVADDTEKQMTAVLDARAIR